MRAPLLMALVLLAGCAADPSADTPAPTDSPAAASPTPTPSPSLPPSPTQTTPTSPTLPPDAVLITGFRFQPETLRVAVGATVTWYNEDEAPHTATADDGSFDTGILAGESSATHTFTSDATVAYFCELHPEMRGTIVVGSGVAAEAEPIPTPSPSPTATPSPSPTPTPTPSPAPVTIDIQDFAFVGTHTVPVGTTVTWTNRDGAPHTATANDGLFDTGTLAQGESGSHTFTSAGSFPYYCAVHPSMTATLTVTA